jgi:hypothetical protein
LVVGPEGGVYRSEKSDSLASRADIEAARHALALGPMRLLQDDGIVLLVYILDLNKPPLERLVASPRHLHPDLLAQSARQPKWRIVSQ